MWDALDDAELAAETESTGHVIVTGSEVLLSSLVMSIAFFGLKKFFIHDLLIYSCVSSISMAA